MERKQSRLGVITEVRKVAFARERIKELLKCIGDKKNFQVK